ncbi:MAG: Ig-like domain-containing protein [Myxococcota bacterium]
MSATGGDPQVAPLPLLGGVRVAVDDVPRLDWTGLQVWDAGAHALDAWIEVDGSSVRVAVDDADADYPITIDPILSGDPSSVALETGVPGSTLGWSIDSDGDRLIVGDPGIDASMPGVAAVVYPTATVVGLPYSSADLLENGSYNGRGRQVAIDGMLAATTSNGGIIHVYERDPLANDWVRNAVLGISACNGVASCPTIDLVDERLIVGVNGDDAGAVKFFRRYDPNPSFDWDATGSFTGDPGAELGASVTGFGRLAAAGAPGAGKVVVYRYDGADQRYTEASELVDPSGVFGSDFGRAIAMHGSWLAVGAPAADRVFLYRDAELVIPTNVVEIVPPSWASTQFGRTVALHDNTLAVTDLQIEGGDAPPRVYVYERVTDTSWVLREAHDLTPGLREKPRPVTLSDSVMAVGELHTRTFRVWRRVADSFEEQQHLSTRVSLGDSIDVSADYVAMGAPYIPFGPSDVGRTTLYRATDPVTVVFDDDIASNCGAQVAVHGKSLALTCPNWDRFASFELGEPLGRIDHLMPDANGGVAIDSDWVVVGTPESNLGGGAEVYRRDGGDWVEPFTINVDNDGATAADAFGTTVAMRSGFIYLGSPDTDQVWVYRLKRKLNGRYGVDLVQQWTGPAGGSLGASLDVDGELIAIGQPGANGGDGGVDLYRGLSLTPESNWRSSGTAFAGGGWGTDVSLAGDSLYVTNGTDRAVRLTRGADGTTYGSPVEVTLGNGVTTVDATSDRLYIGQGASEVNVGAYVAKVTAEGPPVLRNDHAYTTEGGPSVTISVLANDLDPNGDPLVLTAVSGSDTVTVQSATTLRFTPPDDDFDQNVVVTYTVDAGPDQAEALLTVHVTPVPDPPTANDDDQFSMSLDQVLDIPVATLLANDTDPDTGDVLSLASFTQPTNGAVVQDGDLLQFTPATFGVATFDYTVTDGLYTATATVTVNIVNDPPVAHEAPVYELVEDAQLVLGPPGLLDERYVTDPDGDPLTVVAIDPPSAGAVVFSDNGSSSTRRSPSSTSR